MSEKDQSQNEPPRLRPEMASRRLIVLEFVRDYITRWKGSPSLGEIAAGCGISRTRAKQLVRRLVTTGALMRKPGPRGLSLPEHHQAALEHLRAMGWKIDDDLTVASADGDPCTNPTLLPPAALDYIPEHEREGNNGFQRERECKRTGE